MDPNPELTARYIPGLVRSALLEGIQSVPRQVLTDHLLWFVRAALKGRETGIEGGFEADRQVQ